IFSTTLNRMGYHLYSYRHFSSRIKGGHTNNNVRISASEVRAVSDNINILVAFDQQTIDLNAHELVNGGVIIADSKSIRRRMNHWMSSLYRYRSLKQPRSSAAS